MRGTNRPFSFEATNDAASPCVVSCAAFEIVKRKKHLCEVAICKMMNGDQIVGALVEDGKPTAEKAKGV